jgi:hypothetical protein
MWWERGGGGQKEVSEDGDSRAVMAAPERAYVQLPTVFEQGGVKGK